MRGLCCPHRPLLIAFYVKKALHLLHVLYGKFVLSHRLRELSAAEGDCVGF
jgi:hypothetical protein